AKAGGKVGEAAKAEVVVLEKVRAGLDQGHTIRKMGLGEEEHAVLRDLFLLTDKPVLYVANVSEAQLPGAATDPLVAKARAVAAGDGAPLLVICAELEAQIQALPEEERADFLAASGLAEPGLHQLVREGYRLLGLVTFLTA